MIADDEQTKPAIRPPLRRAATKQLRAEELFREYFWFVVKNVIGWVFILASPVLGALIPGPGGLPLFLIGFALVTFPGKRKLTSRVMRGIPMDLSLGVFTFLTALVSIAATVVVF